MSQENKKTPTLFFKGLCLLPSLSLPFISYFCCQSEIRLFRVISFPMLMTIFIEYIPGFWAGFFPLQQLCIAAVNLFAPEDNGINTIWFKSESGTYNILRKKASAIREKMRKK